MKKILIVEDEADVRNNLKDLFESESYQVLTAKDGHEGHIKALEEMPDLILSDIKMPRVDGLELFKRLQKNHELKNTPFVFLTAKVEMSDVREGMSLGADDYLTKPFNLDEVLKVVKVRLEKRDNYLDELEQLRESLLRTVPHELRTPLIGIIGFSELIEDDLENLSQEEIRQMINKIKKSGKRLHRRIEKFLAYAELLSYEAKKENLPETNEQIIEVDQRVVSYRLKQTIEDFSRENDVHVQLEKGNVIISERYYDLIIREVVENALKFSSRGSKVTVIGEKEGAYYTFKISDCGCGMVNTTIKEIHALKQFAEDKYMVEGVGLGLALVQKVIKVYGGYLKLHTKLNTSTTVEFGIPLVNTKTT